MHYEIIRKIEKRTYEIAMRDFNPQNVLFAGIYLTTNSKVEAYKKVVEYLINIRGVDEDNIKSIDELDFYYAGIGYYDLHAFNYDFFILESVEEILIFEVEFLFNADCCYGLDYAIEVCTHIVGEIIFNIPDKDEDEYEED